MAWRGARSGVGLAPCPLPFASGSAYLDVRAGVIRRGSCGLDRRIGRWAVVSRVRRPVRGAGGRVLLFLVFLVEFGELFGEFVEFVLPVLWGVVDLLGLFEVVLGFGELSSEPVGRVLGVLDDLVELSGGVAFVELPV